MSDKTIRGLINLGILVLLLVMVFQLNSIDNKLGSPVAVGNVPTPTPSAPSAPSVGKASFSAASLIDDDAIKGNEDATITIVEWSDFECPFCGRFYSQTLDDIKIKYLDTGKVRFVYRDFPLNFHPQAQKAAEAAECAGEQGKFYEMHDKLFEEGVTGGVSAFKRFAADIGLDTAKFNTCLDSGQTADEVKSDMAAGQAVGISGTPGFIVHTTNDVSVSAISSAIPSAYARNINVLETDDGVAVRISGALPFDAFDAILSAMEV